MVSGVNPDQTALLGIIFNRTHKANGLVKFYDNICNSGIDNTVKTCLKRPLKNRQ